jgi:hypothetical protein
MDRMDIQLYCLYGFAKKGGIPEPDNEPWNVGFPTKSISNIHINIYI